MALNYILNMFTTPSPAEPVSLDPSAPLQHEDYESFISTSSSIDWDDVDVDTSDFDLRPPSAGKLAIRAEIAALKAKLKERAADPDHPGAAQAARTLGYFRDMQAAASLRELYFQQRGRVAAAEALHPLREERRKQREQEQHRREEEMREEQQRRAALRAERRERKRQRAAEREERRAVEEMLEEIEACEGEEEGIVAEDGNLCDAQVSPRGDVLW